MVEVITHDDGLGYWYAEIVYDGSEKDTIKFDTLEEARAYIDGWVSKRKKVETV